MTKMDAKLILIILLFVIEHSSGKTFNGDGLANAFKTFADEAMGVTHLQVHHLVYSLPVSFSSRQRFRAKYCKYCA